MSIASCGKSREVRKRAAAHVSAVAEIPNTAGDDVQAMHVKEFARRYGISKTQTFIEIREGRLLAHKAGGRTLIFKADADYWLRSLPFSKPRKATGRPPAWTRQAEQVSA